MSKKRDNYTFLTQAPVHRVILAMSVPTIISMLVSSMYNMADTYFVGRINTQCTAAVGIVYSVMSVIQALGFFCGHGSGNFISRKLGARQKSEAGRMAATGFVYSFLLGTVVAVVGHIFLTPLALLLGSTPTILPYTEQYLGIILYGAPLMTASLTLNNQMRFQGNALFAMYGILSGVLLNFLLCPLFIFGLGMGLRGAAWATVLSQTCGFVVLFLMTRRAGNIHIRLRQFTPSLHLAKEIVMGGTPSLSRQGLACLSTLMLNHAAGVYGDAAIAGMSIVTRFSFFTFAIVVGLGQGFQPLCGFCYGAGLYRRVREGFAYCVKLGSLFLGTVAVLSFFFSGEIVHLFRHDPEVVRVGAAALRWQVCTFVLVPTIVITNMLLQTIRKPVRANLVAAARSGLFFVPLILILPRFLGLLGVEMCQAAADVCSFTLSVPVAWSAFRDMRRLAAANGPQTETIQ